MPDGTKARAQWSPYYDAWPGGVVDEHGQHPQFLLLHGPVGCGKSHVAVWIMRRFVASRLRVIAALDHEGKPVVIPGRSEPWRRSVAGATWIDCPMWIKRVMDSFSDNEGTPVPQLAHPFAVLDDIGAHREDSDFQDELLALWVRARYSSGGFTVATTNLEPLELRERFPRSASRLCSGPVIRMRGQDARRKRWRLK